MSQTLPTTAPGVRSTATGATPPAWLDHGRVPCLDGLRAVSIALVLVEHASLTHGFPSLGGVHLGTLGHVGVSMFFAISGFLITMLLVRESNRTGTISMRGFYRRRALRILPAYVAFVAVVFLLSRGGAVSLTGADWAGVLTYTVNYLREPAWEIGHVWSLSVEEQFYLVWPLIVLFLSPSRALFVVLGYLAAAPVVRSIIVLFFREHLDMIEYLTPLRLDTIAAGCLLALVAARPEFRARFLQRPDRAVITSAIGAGALVACYVVGREITAFDLSIRYSIEALAMAAIIWSMAGAAQTRVGRTLEARPLVLIGVLSYSLYLWQQLFLNPHSLSWTAAWPVNIVLAVLAALLSYNLIESPFLRIKDRPAYAPDARRTRDDVTAAAVQGV